MSATLAPAQSSQRAKLYRILGDAVAVAVFTVVAVSTWYAFLRSGSIICFSLLLFNAATVALFVTRRHARSISESPLAWLVSFSGTLMPMFMGQALGPSWLVGTGVAIEFVASLLILLALGSLGRSFGIVPANRGVRTGGMYRLVRHPLYAAELLYFLGYAVANPCLQNALALTAEVALQLVRAVMEERLLSRDEAYSTYMRQVRHRLIPGLL